MVALQAGATTYQALVFHDDRKPAGAHALLPRQRVGQPHVIDGVLRAGRTRCFRPAVTLMQA